jgi:glycerophosphoryl diester phosphodiesterase
MILPYSDRPLNFAHRGASHDAPANTLPAFTRAAELGADGVELDVHISSDGVPVVIHDFSLEGTTNGRGQVRNCTLAELKALDAGGWFSADYAGAQIPTLQEVIDAVGHDLWLNIELKTAQTLDDGLPAAVTALVEHAGLVDRVILSSFNPLAIWRAKRLNPQIAVGLLYSQDMPLPLRNPWSRHLLRPMALHPEYTMVDKGYVEWAKSRGYRVHVWTADEVTDMQSMIGAGVDLIITNRPERLTKLLSSA